MIVYDLSCPLSHQFEGWYESSDTFDDLKSRGLIECPVCQSQDIQRLPSVPFIGSSSEKSAYSNDETNVPVHITPQVNEAILNSLRQHLIKAILTNTEDVGAAFTETAKKMYYQEIPEKNIRGIATVDELQELEEEGIEVLVLDNTNNSDIQH